MANDDVYTRRMILRFIVLLIFGVIACRIGYIQLIDTRYKSMAAGNVLNYEVHDYIYFCARPKFDGKHNFARTDKEHAANARAYHEALNKRNIKK